MKQYSIKHYVLLFVYSIMFVLPSVKKPIKKWIIYTPKTHSNKKLTNKLVKYAKTIQFYGAVDLFFTKRGYFMSNFREHIPIQMRFAYHRSPKLYVL